MYPLAFVKKKLLVGQGAGEWSSALYNLYVLNLMAGGWTASSA